MNSDIKIVNGYKIRFNSFFNEWQVSHDEIGRCEEFKTEAEATEYAKKG
jgi:hypothetical protein